MLKTSVPGFYSKPQIDLYFSKVVRLDFSVTSSG